MFVVGCTTSPLYTPQPISEPEKHPVPPTSTGKLTLPDHGIASNKKNVVIVSPEKNVPSSPVIDDSSPQHIASLELVDVGRRNIESGNIDQGISMLERAISLDAYNRRAYYYLSLAWLKKNQPSRALEFAKKAELLCRGWKRELKKVYLLERDIYRKMGDKDKADMYQWKADKL